MKSICFPPSAFCPLPAAYCLRGEFELAGIWASTADYDKMSPLAWERRNLSNFKN